MKFVEADFVEKVKEEINKIEKAKSNYKRERKNRQKEKLMKFKSAGIISLGTYVPERIMTNFDFEKIIDTTDEWIRTRTGVEERRFASPEQATSDLCIEAAKKALNNAKLTAEDIDMIIVATCTQIINFQVQLVLYKKN